jgi:hypothetical protein
LHSLQQERQCKLPTHLTNICFVPSPAVPSSNLEMLRIKKQTSSRRQKQI